ncbi:MAG: hypothetical protein ACOYO1_19380 [Bacteroidales bacterium]
MWLDKFKYLIHLKEIKKEDLAEITEMSRTGIYQALESGSFKFEAMIKILNHYDIDYYDLVEEEYSVGKENTKKYENSNKNNSELDKITKKYINSLEEEIKKADKINDDLSEQNKFLQKIISGNIKSSEKISRAV